MFSHMQRAEGKNGLDVLNQRIRKRCRFNYILQSIQKKPLNLKRGACLAFEGSWKT